MRQGIPGVVALGAALLSACANFDVTAPNENNATVESVTSNPTSAIQNLVSGVLVQQRSEVTGANFGFYSTVGRLGRESYLYVPSESRFTQHYLIGSGGRILPAMFATAAGWAGPYANLRNLLNIRIAVRGAGTALTAQQQSAVLGWVGTMEAYNLLLVAMTRDTVGFAVDVPEDPLQLAPIVSREVGMARIVAKLDSANALLTAGGTAFPFTITGAGFADFATPARFALFNRGLAARANIYICTNATPDANGLATQSTSPACAAALTAVNASFLPAGATFTPAQLDVGPRFVYSTSAGDALNSLNQGISPTFVAHPSIVRDREAGDPRVNPQAAATDPIPTGSKIRRLPAAQSANPPSSGIETNFGFAMYGTNTTPVPIMRAEELLLIRAEAKLHTGDAAGAIADVNALRAAYGLGTATEIGAGLPSTWTTPLAVASGVNSIVNRILYERRYSLLLEGHRWVDVRRYNKFDANANTPQAVALDQDLTTHIKARVLPFTQGECLVRQRNGGAASTARPTLNPQNGCS